MSASTRRVPLGLPTNPRSRQPMPVFSGSRQYEDSRPSRSMPASRTRNPPPQREQVPDTNRRVYQPQQRDDYPETRNVRRSGDSSSTSSSENESSFWSRGNSSQSSSRTTPGSDDELTYSEMDRETYSNDSQDNNSHSYAANTGYVWSRVTEVANVFTHEVSKVWATGLGNAVYENVEGESHLINVMRAYHLFKARTPSELPEWLFSERERGQGGLLRLDPRNDGGEAKAEPIQPAQRRNRPEITYQDKSPRLGTQSKNIKTAMPLEQSKVSGADRLKQMRSLRRTAPTY